MSQLECLHSGCTWGQCAEPLPSLALAHCRRRTAAASADQYSCSRITIVQYSCWPEWLVRFGYWTVFQHSELQDLQILYLQFCSVTSYRLHHSCICLVGRQCNVPHFGNTITSKHERCLQLGTTYKQLAILTVVGCVTCRNSIHTSDVLQS